MEKRIFDYDVYCYGIKEYKLTFENPEDAEAAFDRAVDWSSSYRGIYDQWIGNEEIYIICNNEVLHQFIREVLEAELGLQKGE